MSTVDRAVPVGVGTSAPCFIVAFPTWLSSRVWSWRTRTATWMEHYWPRKCFIHVQANMETWLRLGLYGVLLSVGALVMMMALAGAPLARRSRDGAHVDSPDPKERHHA